MAKAAWAVLGGGKAGPVAPMGEEAGGSVSGEAPRAVGAVEGVEAAMDATEGARGAAGREGAAAGRAARVATLAVMVCEAAAVGRTEKVGSTGGRTGRGSMERGREVVVVVVGCGWVLGGGGRNNWFIS